MAGSSVRANATQDVVGHQLVADETPSCRGTKLEIERRSDCDLL